MSRADRLQGRGISLRPMTTPRTHLATESPRQVFDALLDHLAHGRWQDAIALYADDVTVSNPFAADGSASASSGRAAVEQFFGFLASRVSALQAEGVVVHETTDPETVIAEFRFVGTSTDASFELPAVFVLRVRDGVIVESRDYMGPQRALAE